MSIIWITHDLGIIAGLVERVQVMYAGFIVEKAPVKELFADPRHPYTIGLLNSLPRIDKRAGDQQLIPIGGLPPDLIDLPRGCPFAARCKFVIDRCWTENPQLREVGDSHEIACWVDIREAVYKERS